MPSLGVITSSAIPNLMDSDQRVLERIERESDWKVQVVLWEQPPSNLEEIDAFIFRSCWDYHLHYTAFNRFLDRLEVLHKPVLNPLDAIRKNAHKFYLAELQLKHIQIIPTIFLRKGEEARLSHIMEDNHWDQAVVKPAVSAASHNTWLALFSDLNDKEKKFNQLLQERDLLVQPFIPEIQGTGEYSTIFFADGSNYTIRKTPIDGDFRIQKEYGGIYEKAILTKEEQQTMQRIWDKVSDGLLFGRIDGIFEEGQFYLMELELIEPDLYLDIYPEYEKIFSENILHMLTKQMRDKHQNP